jgi:hypothetical protein
VATFQLRTHLAGLIDFRIMLHGKVFHRAMYECACNRLLPDRIRSERGSSSQDEAIAAVRKHIEYYEGLRNVNLNAMHSVVERHAAYRIAPPPSGGVFVCGVRSLPFGPFPRLPASVAACTRPDQTPS